MIAASTDSSGSRSAPTTALIATGTSSGEPTAVRSTHHTPPGCRSSSSDAREQRQARLTRTPTAGDSHQPLSTRHDRVHHLRQLTITPNQLRPARGQVRRPHRLRPRRRKSSRTPTIDHRTKQHHRRRKILQTMNTNRLRDQLIADQLPRRRGQQQLPTMSRRRNPRRPMNLKAHIARPRSAAPARHATPSAPAVRRPPPATGAPATLAAPQSPPDPPTPRPRTSQKTRPPQSHRQTHPPPRSRHQPARDGQPTPQANRSQARSLTESNPRHR